eukprot:15445353-Alexandrium_andersonii.AAC.1
MEPLLGTPIGTSRTAPVAVRFEIRANNSTERTPQELRGLILRPLLGPCSPSSECMEQVCMLGTSCSERLLFGVNACRYDG